MAEVNEDIRPKLTGIYSDLDSRVDAVSGLQFESQVDNRYDSYATPTGIVAILLAVLAFIASPVSLRSFDALAARRPLKFATPGGTPPRETSPCWSCGG